jgi:2'-5' RNA ligase
VAKTHQTALVLIPPRPLWDPIQSYRDRLDPRVRRWMPHITLLYPFAPPGRWERLGPRLQAACSATTPFELTLARAGSFRHPGGGFTLWLAPEPPEPVQALQRRLLAAAPGYDDTARVHGGFTPHLSLGQVARRAGLEVLLGQLRDTWVPVTFRVTTLCLIHREEPPRDRFRISRRFPLGPDAGSG